MEKSLSQYCTPLPPRRLCLYADAADEDNDAAKKDVCAACIGPAARGINNLRAVQFALRPSLAGSPSPRRASKSKSKKLIRRL